MLLFPTMKTDLPGRIRNTRLPDSHYLLPLLEAVVNSIQSIDEAENVNGVIEIVVQRASKQLTLGNESSLSPVTGFIVKDNGIGFNDINLESFDTADSSHKEKIGGKGVGRITWLVAFSRAEIESHFATEDNSFAVRTFSFTPTLKGIENLKTAQSSLLKSGTTVKLQGYKQRYQAKCPRHLDIIAKRIIDHCIEYFVLETCPQIMLIDETDGTSIDLKNHFQTKILRASKQEEFVIGDEKFQINHLYLTPTDNTGHQLVFCAHKRAVKELKLQGKLFHLLSQFKDGQDKPYIYAGYVSGKYLDSHVSSERIQFDIIPDDTEENLFGDISWDNISKNALVIAEKFLKPHTEPVQKANKEKITLFVENQEPIYLPLLKYRKNELNSIQAGLNDEKLELELHKIYQEHLRDLRIKFREVLSTDSAATVDEIEAQISSFLTEWNETGNAVLVEYVKRRRSTLEVLDRAIKLGENNKYALEKVIHSIIFPMRVTSHDVNIDNTNLWIIDERLSYHNYLSSDLKFSKIEEKIIVEGEERPDLLIFQTANAFVSGEPRDAVTIVEFKRPMRENYDSEENPVDQVLDYVDKIRTGHWKDKDGQLIEVAPTTPFYAYIIADLTPKLKGYAKKFSATESPGGGGYFWFNQQYLCYIEIISYKKLLNDSKKRNAIFFEKLGIPLKM